MFNQSDMNLLVFTYHLYIILLLSSFRENIDNQSKTSKYAIMTELSAIKLFLYGLASLVPLLLALRLFTTTRANFRFPL